MTCFSLSFSAFILSLHFCIFCVILTTAYHSGPVFWESPLNLPKLDGSLLCVFLVLGTYFCCSVTMQPSDFSTRRHLDIHDYISCIQEQAECQFSSFIQSYRLFATPWTAAHQVSLSITNSWYFLRPMSIESVMPSNHLIFCCPLLLLPSIFPSIRSFPMSQFFASGGQIIGASASVLPMNIQD